MLTGLVSVPMTEDELSAVRRRRGYWLRLARRQANLNQDDAARLIGLSENSGTSILHWEKGTRSPNTDQLEQLARVYGVPVSTLMEPRPTDEEWLAQLAGEALREEAQDWEAEQDRGAGAEPDEPPGTPPG